MREELRDVYSHLLTACEAALGTAPTMRRSSAYRVYLTRNSEYHIRDYVCVGVRDRRSGCWREDHPTLRRPLAGTFADTTGRMRSLSPPSIGESLQFEVNGTPLFTSAVLSIEEREGFSASDLGRPARAKLAKAPPLSPRDTH